MKRSLVKLKFSNIDTCLNNLVAKGKEWRTITYNLEPNNWSIRFIFLQEIQDDDTVLAELMFLVPEAEYLHKPDTEFDVFGYKNFKCVCKIISNI